MRILVIAATYPPTRCGVGDYVRRLGWELGTYGSEVFVLTGASDDEEHDHGDPTVASVEARPVIEPNAGLEFLVDEHHVRLCRGVERWDWSALDAVAGAIESVAPDVINLQYHGEDYLLHPAVCAVGDLAAASGRPLVTIFHNLQQPLPWEEGDDPLDHLMRGSAGWICTNTIDERRLREHPVAKGRLHTIPTGPSITADDGAQRSAPAGPLRVGYFGFLNPFKGIEYLLRAVATLHDEGRAIRLEMAAGVHTDAPGRLRDYAGFIDDEIERLGIAPILERRGFIPESEVSALLRRVHVAVFPFREGISGKNTSFWSTMQHATPTLTTSGEGAPAGLVDGETTLLVPVEDVAAMAERLRWADGHRDELEAIGRRGRAYVEHSFAWTAIARHMHEVFDAARAGIAN